MRIDVTQEDIDHGEIREYGRCPIAFAIDRQTGMFSKVFLDVIAFYSIKTGRPDSWQRQDDVRTPNVALAWIRTFDSGNPAAPFSFELPIDHIVGLASKTEMK